MKRKVLLPITIVVIVVIAAVCWYLMPKTFAKNIDPADIDHLSIFDGRTEIGFTIENRIEIEMIIKSIQKQSMRRTGFMHEDYAHAGYAFSVEGVDKDGKTIIPIFYIQNEHVICKRPFLYASEERICIDLLEELEYKYNDTYLSDIYVDDEENELSIGADGAVIVNGIPYYATGSTYGDAICGNGIKSVVMELNGKSVTAWSPVFEGTICILIDGEWTEFSNSDIE